METPQSGDRSPPRIGLLRWLIIVGGVVAVIVAVIVTNAALRARNARRVAIVTITEIVPGEYGTLRIKYKTQLEGYDVTFRLAKRSGTSNFVFSKTSRGDWFANWLFPVVGELSSSEGSYQLGDCPKSGLVATPYVVELEVGQEFVVATCKDKLGRPVELFFSLKP